MKKAYLSNISYYLPDKVLSNADISKRHPEWSIEKIAVKTGIQERRIAGENEFVSDMAVKAANIFFEEHRVDKKIIDFILLCTQNPDYVLPTTACIIQNKLNLSKSIGALDFNLGCSGYIYGLGLAKGLIQSNQAKNVLLITSEVYSKIINDQDKSNKTLFGDAASVSLVSVESSSAFASFEILDFVYGTDGSGYDNLIVKNSGARRKNEMMSDVSDEDGKFLYNDDFLYMDGTKIFNFTAFQVPPLVEQVLRRNNLSDSSISYYIFHQANAFMLDFVRKRCGIPDEKFFISMNDIGNTVSSTVPIALKRLLERDNSSIDNILLCGFGVGLSVGGVIIKKV